jgi:3-hydroxybutyryl-CoA dehydrogenase
MIQKIAVAGAGTMGSGIALCAAQNGFETVLFDTNRNVVDKALESINKTLDSLFVKNKITSEDKDAILARMTFTDNINDCVAPLIIEAIIEKAEIKTTLFNKLAVINDSQSIFATNTSSLSVNLIQKDIPHPERVAGMHFFNPAQIMKLVEVVKAKHTSDAAIQSIMEVCKQMKKTPVLCIDAPGFIVNRVARHYYLEAMKLVEKGIATFETVDEIMEASGFKMGPFKLMDLIGMDINLAVSTSLYEAFDHEPRFEPSPIQIKKVKEGELGKKTGRGFYVYN